jgi:hypothetical protein
MVLAVHEFDYLDLDLLIERSAPDYRIRVLSSPAGQTPPLPFQVPFSDLQIEEFLLKIGRPRQTVRRVDAPQIAAIKEFGGKLFEAVFRSDLATNLASSLSIATAAHAGLRIRLRLADCPELADLPWEYLYDKGRNRFLCLSDRTPLVRYLDLPEPVRALAVTPPLRVLVLIASPAEYPALDGEREWRNVTEALNELVRAGRVEVERLAQPTLRTLQRQLRRGRYHVFHFIGHGGFDSQTQDGVLAFEDSNRRAHLVSGEDLGTLLYDHRSLRLAVLNACEGARGDRTDPFAGTAQSLVQQGIPAVIAMQFEITDAAAIIFAQVLYEAVADGYPLDAATAEARKAIHAHGNGVEWGTPVLYLRAVDGRIFDMLVPAAQTSLLATTADRAAEQQARREAEEQAREAEEQASDGGRTGQRVERGDCIGHLDSPQPGTEVGTWFQTNGVVQAIPKHHHVWIAVQIDPGGLIWPKGSEVIPDDDGHFEQYVYQGGSSRGFFILLLLTAEVAHAEFANWMEEGSWSGHYPGIPPAPMRFIELDRVAVRSGSLN